MSDYHIRKIGQDFKTVDVVFHYLIPTGTNAVGETWRSVIVRDLGGADNIISVLPEINGTAEETAMKAGEKLEISTNIRFSSLELTNAQRLAEVETQYTLMAAERWAQIQITHNFFGKIGDV